MLSSLIFCQNTNTNPLSKDQIAELYKGLKQNEYLKERISKTDKALANADLLITEQKDALLKKDLIIKDQETIINNNQLIYLKDIKIKDAEIERLYETEKINIQIARKNSRKQFWNGIKIGGISVAILGGATAAFLILK